MAIEILIKHNSTDTAVDLLAATLSANGEPIGESRITAGNEQRFYLYGGQHLMVVENPALPGSNQPSVTDPNVRPGEMNYEGPDHGEDAGALQAA